MNQTACLRFIQEVLQLDVTVHLSCHFKSLVTSCTMIKWSHDDMSIKPSSFHCGFKSSHNIMGVDVVDGQQHLQIQRHPKEQRILRNDNFQNGLTKTKKITLPPSPSRREKDGLSMWLPDRWLEQHPFPWSVSFAPLLRMAESAGNQASVRLVGTA